MPEFLLSPQQRHIWNLQGQTEKVLLTKCCILINGASVQGRLPVILDRILSDCEALRTIFVQREELEFPLQTVVNAADSPVDYSWYDRNEAWEEQWLISLYEDDRSFQDIFSGRGICFHLVRKSAAEHCLVIKALSMLLDGPSLQQLADRILRELREYEGLSEAGGTQPAASSGISYAQYAAWQQENLDDKAVDYWQSAKFRHAGDLQLMLEKNRGIASPAPVSGRTTATQTVFHITGDRKEKVDHFLRSNDIDPSLFFHSCWNALLYRLSGRLEFVTGYVSSGRDINELAGILGAMTRIIPVSVALQDEPDLLHMADGLRKEIEEGADWKDYYMQGYGTHTDQTGSIPYWYGYSKDDASRAGGGSYSAETIWSSQEFEYYRMWLSITAGATAYTARLIWNGLYFDSGEATRIAHYLEHLVDQLIGNPGTAVASIEIPDDKERTRIVDGFNDRSLSVPQSSVVTLLVVQAERLSDLPAVNDGEVILSYGELNERANRLAHFLITTHGTQKGDLVALLTDRSVNLIVAIMGVLKTGAAYLPLETAWPAERITTVLREAACHLAVSQQQYLNLLPEDVRNADIADDRITGQPSSDPEVPVSPGDLAYVIFTSGSTGKPKGVMINHDTIINLCYGLRQDTGLPELPGIPFSLFASAAFDASVQQIFGCLLSGGCLHIIGDAVKKDIPLLIRFLQEHAIQVFDCTPAILTILLEEAGASLRQTGLKKVLVGGEAWTDKLLSLYQSHDMEGSGIEFFNVYGPTECGVDSTIFSLRGKEFCGFVPIGIPLPNKHIYILDDNGMVVPTGMQGEIFIGGRGIATGYLHRDDLTRDAFLPSPFRRGETLYRTGDLGKWMPDGNIRFLGRRDDQLKIRGYRVEPAEIAATLTGHPGVDKAYVYASEREGGQKVLTAAIVPDKHTAHTVLQIARHIEADPSLSGSLFRMPNGLPVWYANKSELDLIYDEIFVDKVYQKYNIQVNEGDVVFDIGANIGLFSLFMGLTYPGIRLYAFEPIGPVYEILRRNLSLYPVDAKAFNAGISDREGLVKFNYYPVNTVLSGRYGDMEEERSTVQHYLRNRSGSKNLDLEEKDLSLLLKEGIHSVEVDCRIRRLSDVIREENVERIDLLKIDVEKSEMEVISGIEEQDWKKVRQVIIEVHDRKGELDKIVNILERQGFTVHTEQDPLLINTCLYNVYATRGTAAGATAEKVCRYEGWVDNHVLQEDIKSYAASRLPEYMVPADLYILDALPLNSSGKVDRKALQIIEERTRFKREIAAQPENDIEKLLIGVWQEVLGLSQVRTDDDFFMIGGDSIKAIQISSRLHKAGYKITIRDILNHSVLSELAPYVKKIKKTALQQEVMGVVPLLPAQHEFFALGRTSPHHFNLPLLFFSPDRLDANGIRAIFQHLWEHHDALRMVFRQTASGWEQENKDSSLPFGFREYQLVEPFSSPGVMKELDALQSSLNLQTGPLLKVGLFHTSKGDHLLVITHHLIVDGVSWRILFEDIEALLRQHRSGMQLKLPQKTHSFKEWAESLKSYANSSEILGERGYWREVGSGTMDAFRTDQDPANNRMRENEYVTCQLSEQDTSLLLTTVNKVFNTRINDILLTALAVSLYKTWQLARIPVTMEGHGRENILEGLDINRTVGWFTSLYPVILQVAPGEDLAAQIRRTKKYINAIPNNGIGYGILKYLTDKKHTTDMRFDIRPSISFNYLGQFDEDTRHLSMEVSEESFGSSFNADDKRDHLLDIVSKVSGRQLSVVVCYNRLHFPETQMRAFTECYKTALREIVRLCVSQPSIPSLI